MSDDSALLGCPGLDVLEWLMDNEHDLPIDDTQLLKCIGWVWASRVERTITSDPIYDGNDGDYELPEHPIAEEVFCKIAHDRTAGERGLVNYSPYTDSVRPTMPPDGPPTTGWWLRGVMQLWNVNCEAGELKGGAFLYWYFKKGSDEQQCPVYWTGQGSNEQQCPVYWTKYNNDYHVVAFMLAGRWITMMSREHEIFFSRTTGCGVARDVDQPWQLEFVRIDSSDRPGSFEYVLYDSKTMVGSVLTTATNTCRTRLWLHNYRSVEPSDESPFLADANRDDFSLVNRFSKLLITPGTSAALPSEGLKDAMMMTQSMYFLGEFRRYERYSGASISKTTAISALLAERLRRRLVRVASRFLLAKAQAAEERRAADPVRKCAACAVEAVKGQLALGIEPATKRMCVGW